MSKVAAIILVITTLCFASFFVPGSMQRDLAISVLLAMLLIVLLIVRAQHWHRSDAIDIVVILFAFCAAGYLFTFSGVPRDAIGLMLTGSIGLLSLLLAGANLLSADTVLVASSTGSFQLDKSRGAATHGTKSMRPKHTLQTHDSTGQVHTNSFQAHTAHSMPARSAVHQEFSGAVKQQSNSPVVLPTRRLRIKTAFSRMFRRGLQPIQEVRPKELHEGRVAIAQHNLADKKQRPQKAPIEPLHEITPLEHTEPAPVSPRRMKSLVGFFRRRSQAVEPIKEIVQPRPGKPHDQTFVRGVERIQELDEEITAQHLHKLGTYDLEPLKTIEPSDELTRTGLDDSRSTQSHTRRKTRNSPASRR